VQLWKKCIIFKTHYPPYQAPQSTTFDQRNETALLEPLHCSVHSKKSRAKESSQILATGEPQHISRGHTAIEIFPENLQTLFASLTLIICNGEKNMTPVSRKSGQQFKHWRPAKTYIQFVPWELLCRLLGS
jgi:hypothetical protein